VPSRRRRSRGPRGDGSIEQLSSGRWRLKVPLSDGTKRTYGIWETEPEALNAQARWRLTRLLPGDDPELIAQTGLAPETVAAVASEDVRLDEWFIKWQEAKRKRAQVVVVGPKVKRSVIRKSKKRGGASSTAARDVRFWTKWWSPRIGKLLPTSATEDVIEEVLTAIEEKLEPNTVRTHMGIVKAFLTWLAEEGKLPANPIAHWVADVDPAADRARPIVVPDFAFIDMLSDALGDFAPSGVSKRNKSGYVGVSFQKSTGKWQAFHKKTYLGLFTSPEEANAALIEERRSEGGSDRLIFELLLGTAGRRSEVAGFRIGEVDHAAKRIWVLQPVVTVEGRLERQATPKSRKSRSVIIGPRLDRLIQDEITRRRNPGPGEPLVVSAEGGIVDFNNWIERRLRPSIEIALLSWGPHEMKRLVDEEGLGRAEAERRMTEQSDKLRRLRPHHLRHTAAALMWAAGATDLEVQEILGHSELQTSKLLYAHILDGVADTTARRVEEMRDEMRRLREAS
jgi:integrase